MSERQDRIYSPAGATYEAEQNLYDAADNDAALIATVHEVPDGAVGNIWLRSRAELRKCLPERFLSGRSPTPLQLAGETLRLAMSQNLGATLGIDSGRWSLAVRGLAMAARAPAAHD